MKILCAALCAVLVACGGGGSNPTAGVAVYSDSTGVGTDCNVTPCQRVAHPWPSYVLGAVNLSAGSNSTSDLLSGTGHGLGSPWAQLMKESAAGTVVIGLAINDAYAISLQEYSDNLVSIIRTARQNGKRVVLATPVCIVPRVQPYIEEMRKVASSQGVQLIDLSAQATDFFGAGLPGHLGDSMHPDQTVYTFMGQAAARSIF